MFHTINSLDSFLKYDPDQTLLCVQSFHTVSLIARIYTADSHSHKEQAHYWLDYMQGLAMEIKENSEWQDTALKQA